MQYLFLPPTHAPVRVATRACANPIQNFIPPTHAPVRVATQQPTGCKNAKAPSNSRARAGCNVVTQIYSFTKQPPTHAPVRVATGSPIHARSGFASNSRARAGCNRVKTFLLIFHSPSNSRARAGCNCSTYKPFTMLPLEARLR
jgi:hypothetical protein